MGAFEMMGALDARHRAEHGFDPARLLTGRAAELADALIPMSRVKPVLRSRYLVKGWLDRGAMSVVYGESNVGKTFFALDMAAHVAAALDATLATRDYSAALASARALLAQPAATPSARVLAGMAQAHDNSFTGFTLEQSARARAALLELPWRDAQQACWAERADASVDRQKALEQGDTQPFEEWRQHYMAAQGLG